jgi:hypothetical protein
MRSRLAAAFASIATTANRVVPEGVGCDAANAPPVSALPGVENPPRWLLKSRQVTDAIATQQRIAQPLDNLLVPHGSSSDDCKPAYNSCRIASGKWSTV